jgi:hypothetical protein
MRQIAEVPAKEPKAPYNPPRLISYGDLPHMTRTMFGGTGMMDSAGAGNPHKT